MSQHKRILKEAQTVLSVLKHAKDDDGKRGGISGKTGAGVNDLKHNIWTYFNNKTQNVGIATRERHRISMVDAKQFLKSCVKHIVIKNVM